MEFKQSLAQRIIIAFALMSALVAGAFAMGIVATVHLVEEKLISAGLGGDLQRLLLMLPRVHHLDRLLVQAGSTSTVSHLLAASSVLVLVGLVAGLVLQWPVFLIVLVLVLKYLPDGMWSLVGRFFPKPARKEDWLNAPALPERTKPATASGQGSRRCQALFRCCFCVSVRSCSPKVLSTSSRIRRCRSSIRVQPSSSDITRRMAGW